LEFYETIPDTAELRRVRVVVYENPFARIPFSRDLFRGPFDERWALMARICGEFTSAARLLPSSLFLENAD
jgi:hypothetical protein